MIYVSSSCVKHNNIKSSVLELISNGFKNIELSGGTQYYDGFENDLLELKEKYNLNYMCHNYFPPPKEHFVLNLASLNNDIYEKTFNHLADSISLSKKLGAKKFGFHAGFFMDINVSEIGKKISKTNLFNKEKAMQRFCDGFKELQKNSNGITLYIENNVFSHTNHKTYKGEQVFMLCHFKDHETLIKNINFNLLLDMAHLKVSSHTLGLDFLSELSNMISKTDYIHISDNDGLHDLNQTLKSDSDLITFLKKQELKNIDFTLEVYDGIKQIKQSYKLLQEAIQ